MKNSFYPIDKEHGFSAERYFCYVFDEEVTLGDVDISKLLMDKRENNGPVFIKCTDIVEKYR